MRQARTPRRPGPANMRFGQSTRRRITSPRLLTVSTQHVPPQSPPGPLRSTHDPRGPSRLSGRGVGSGGGEPRAQVHKGGREGSKTQSKSKDSNRGRHQDAVSNFEGIPARVRKRHRNKCFCTQPAPGSGATRQQLEQSAHSVAPSNNLRGRSLHRSDHAQRVPCTTGATL